jgi:hypothetical protein
VIPGSDVQRRVPIQGAIFNYQIRPQLLPAHF